MTPKWHISTIRDDIKESTYLHGMEMDSIPQQTEEKGIDSLEPRPPYPFLVHHGVHNGVAISIIDKEEEALKFSDYETAWLMQSLCQKLWPDWVFNVIFAPLPQGFTSPTPPLMQLDPSEEAITSKNLTSNHMDVNQRQVEVGDIVLFRPKKDDYAAQENNIKEIPGIVTRVFSQEDQMPLLNLSCFPDGPRSGIIRRTSVGHHSTIDPEKQAGYRLKGESIAIGVGQPHPEG